jgi:hypothetical protein
METLYKKKVTKVLSRTHQKHCKTHLRIYKHKKNKYHPKIFMKSLNHKHSMNDLDPANAPKIQKPESRVRKLRASDIKWSNPYGD